MMHGGARKGAGGSHAGVGGVVGVRWLRQKAISHDDESSAWVGGRWGKSEASGPGSGFGDEIFFGPMGAPRLLVKLIVKPRVIGWPRTIAGANLQTEAPSASHSAG